MQPILQQQWQELCQVHEKFWQTVATQSPQKRTQQPAAEAWNLAQVCHHIWLAEDSTLRFVTQKTPLKPTFIQKIRSFVLGNVLKVLLKTPLKFKAPKVVLTDINRQTMSYDQIMERWQETAKAWESYLATFPSEKNNLHIFKHPIAGPLNIEQTLRFLITHCQHHQFQLERIIAVIA